MTTYGDRPHARPANAPNPLSVAWVVAATILSVGGLTMLLFFIMFFAWIYFLGVAPLCVGILMFFSPRAGSNRSLY